MWKIETGIVRTLSWLEDGTLIALGLWGCGDTVVQFLSNAHPYQIETLTEVEAIEIPLHQWQPDRETLLSYLQQGQELLLIRAGKRAEENLLRVLNWLARRVGSKVNNGYLLDLKLTHKDLAEFSGLTRVTVTRILNQLEQQGFIQRLSRRLVVLDEKEIWHYEI